MDRKHEMKRPTLKQYTDADGYPDYYGYDMAMEQWRDQFPSLSERWCPVAPVAMVLDSGLQDLIAQLLA